MTLHSERRQMIQKSFLLIFLFGISTSVIMAEKSETKQDYADADDVVMETEDLKKDAKKVVEVPADPTKDHPMGTWRLVAAGSGNENLKFEQISVGDSNNVWAVGDDKKVYRLAETGWVNETAGTYVSAASDGTVYVINDKNVTFKPVGESKFEPVAGIQLTQVSVGSAQAVWGIEQDGKTSKTYSFENGQWNKVKASGDEDLPTFTQLSVDKDGVVLAVDSEGSIFRRDIERVEAAERNEGSVKAVKVDREKRKQERKARRAQAKADKKKNPAGGQKSGAMKVNHEAKKADKKAAKKSAKAEKKAAKKETKKAARQEKRVEGKQEAEAEEATE